MSGRSSGVGRVASLAGRLRRFAPGGAPGYRRGATLARVAADLGAALAAAGGGDAARMALDDRIALRATERVDRQFLLHTVSVQLERTLAGPDTHGSASIAASGWVRRGPAAATIARDADARFGSLVRALLAVPSLNAPLAALDLTYCEIAARGRRWTLRIVPFGGSEVVGRMPSFRRYVRLADTQRDALHAAFAGFEAALARLPGD
ncbi:DUF3156 family protein [Burkholderia thailandensis]|uniref:DUF3156 domain-containing protein n=1 Tax=Burkholderia thailandensis TaxID=57975 RepID=A0AAW9CLA8_BURTH|nr:DUF3156 family protein [Burkholderia thailandensis]AHI67729.1 hypothetical protein BTL_4297 [Burkholderia thailandensis H0587]AIP65722.1 hypothetical protein DR62_3984 [Burkholderia thailandensis]AJY31471.1 hypothetical protein BTM_5360 [Burkholderia thailandensis 34]AOI55033.1 hypothetical protein WI24_24930 [Burkholderia thailandensis]AOJ54066.1 hypothetical protein AQ475_25070 [Burkholderia thailandensis]